MLDLPPFAALTPPRSPPTKSCLPQQGSLFSCFAVSLRQRPGCSCLFVAYEPPMTMAMRCPHVLLPAVIDLKLVETKEVGFSQTLPNGVVIPDWIKRHATPV